MNLLEFLKGIAGLALGFITTGALFGIGHAFMEDVFLERNPDTFILTISAMIWLVVSYGLILLVF